MIVQDIFKVIFLHWIYHIFRQIQPEIIVRASVPSASASHAPGEP